ncbi:hypothetical protein [Faecalibacter bovis]|uniref:Uncharacterized protein n=1 Tax=Faecalibacter bovis TaxID=2898187 RepID=A0ABX7XC96_9FLAO|nr:hypothetical protein [Faecalibacter bovis]QTV05536.1 hypothetical protein J9309_12305 [Faecalibacter bovis]
MGLKRIPKLFLEQVDVILTEYSNQFDSLFRPSKINLIVGIYHFQSLTREELKSLIINELSKYNNKNELDLIKFRNWEFSTSIKFYTSELTEKSKRSIYYFLFFYIYCCEKILIRTFLKLSKLTQQYEEILKKINSSEKVYTKEYHSALTKITEFIVINNFVENQISQTFNNYYGTLNKFELTREILNRFEFKKQILVSHYNVNFYSAFFNTHLVNYYFQDYSKFEPKEEKFITENKESVDRFKLNFQEKYEVNLTENNNCNEMQNSVDFVNTIQNLFQKTNYPEFINILNNFIEFDFKKIQFSPKDSSNSITKQNLINQENIDFIKQANSLLIDYKFIRNLDSLEYEGIYYETDREINKLLLSIENKINNNFSFINNFTENLYIFLKSNHADESTNLIKTINELIDYESTANEIYYQLYDIKNEIYNETRHKLLEDLFKKYDELINLLKVQINKNLNNSEVRNLFPNSIIDFLLNEANCNIVYYEKGIYNKEGFERIDKLAEWNVILISQLVKRHKKMYFEMNKDLFNI